MTTDQNRETKLESRLKEAEEENELLLAQLHQVQEELEQYYLRNQELEKTRSSSSISVADDELPEALSENQRLHALVEVQRKIHQLEAQNALNTKLGNILIQGVDSGSLFSVPLQLGKIWREFRQQTPPESLGGKDFGKLIATYEQGGFDAVEKLMLSLSISPPIQANGYTALARHLMQGDRARAAEAARHAHALDPKPYRLKWLAFRLHEAGKLIEAEAMLDVLPPDTPFSDSETRQAGRLRNEVKQARQNEAKKKSRFDERRATVERQLNKIAEERDEQIKLMVGCNQQIEALKQAKAKLEQEKSALKKHQEERTEKFEHEKSALTRQYEKTVNLAEERNREIETLKRVQTRLEQEKSALAKWQKEQVKLAADHIRQINELRQQITDHVIQINELQQQIKNHEVNEASLATRQQLMHEEMIRAEAQLDLIKDILLREPGI